MTSFTITLPDDVAEVARGKGLLSPAAISSLIHEASRAAERNETDRGDKVWPAGFDPGLKGKISPVLFGRGETLGDIVAPLGLPWDADS